MCRMNWSTTDVPSAALSILDCGLQRRGAKLRFGRRRLGGSEHATRSPACVEALARFGLGDEHENYRDSESAHGSLSGVKIELRQTYSYC